MGICVRKLTTHPPGTIDHHQRHHHPDGVAGLKPEEIDQDPFHVNPKGVVSSLPFIELAGVRDLNNAICRIRHACQWVVGVQKGARQNGCRL